MNIFLCFITQPDVQVFVYLTVVQDLGQSVIVTSQIMMLMMVLELFLQVRGWTAWSCFLLSCLIFFFILFACFLFLFSLFHYSIEDAGFAECIVEKKSFPDYSMEAFLLKNGELKSSTVHSLIFLSHIILHIWTTGWFKLLNCLLHNVPSIIKNISRTQKIF